MCYLNITKYVLMENENSLRFLRETVQLKNLKYWACWIMWVES